MDLHNREFYIYQTITNTNQMLLNLVLLPYRTNITTRRHLPMTPTCLSQASAFPDA